MSFGFHHDLHGEDMALSEDPTAVETEKLLALLETLATAVLLEDSKAAEAKAQAFFLAIGQDKDTLTAFLDELGDMFGESAEKMGRFLRKPGYMKMAHEVFVSSGLTQGRLRPPISFLDKSLGWALLSDRVPYTAQIRLVLVEDESSVPNYHIWDPRVWRIVYNRAGRNGEDLYYHQVIPNPSTKDGSQSKARKGPKV